MVIGQDITICRDDKSGARRWPRRIILARYIAKEATEQFRHFFFVVVLLLALIRGSGCGNIDDRWCCLFYQPREFRQRRRAHQPGHSTEQQQDDKRQPLLSDHQFRASMNSLS